MKQMGTHFGPFTLVQAVHHRIANRAIAAQRVAANDTVFFGPQAFNRPLAGVVEIVRAPAHHVAAQRLETLRQQQ